MADAINVVATQRVHFPAAVTLALLWQKTAGHARVRYHHHVQVR